MTLSDAEFFVEVFQNRQKVAEFITKVNGKQRIYEVDATNTHKAVISVPECLQLESMRVILARAEELISHYDSIIAKYNRTEDI